MPEPTAMYRLWAENEVLLYVGISKHPPTRFDQHAGDKPWWPFVAYQDIEWFDSRWVALAAESLAITDEAPLFNRQGNGGRERPYERMFSKGWFPILNRARIPVYAEAVQAEPALLDLLEEVQGWGQGRCGECEWPELKRRAADLVGFGAGNPLAQSSRLYEAVMATLYESLPWSICKICGAA